jgi:hypothetical protein
MVAVADTVTAITNKNSYDMEKQLITLNEALNGKRSFYAKKWQQNDFYPIEKYVYHADTDEFEQFDQKISGWNSWGIPKAGSVPNKEWLRYIFEHGNYRLSFDEFKDDKHWNNV